MTIKKKYSERKKERKREKGRKIEFIKLGSFLQSQKELTGKNYQKYYGHSKYKKEFKSFLCQIFHTSL